MLNRVTLQGRLVADAELRYTPSGVAVANFRVACDRNVKNDQGERDADFINVVCWKGTAEFVAKWFHKGDMIVLEGRLQTRNYEDKNGRKVYVTEVVADHCFFTGSKKDGQNNNRNNGGYDNSGYGGNNYGGYGNSGGFGTPVSFSDEDLPF